jgi:hypothetical protein
MATRQSRLNPTAAAGFMQRIMSNRTIVRLARVAEGVPDRPWTDAQDENLRTLIDAAPWQTLWAAVAVCLSPHLPGAFRTSWAQANVGTWTPLGDGRLLGAVGDGDVDWEEVEAAVGPLRTAVSCWSRWVIVGSSPGLPRQKLCGDNEMLKISRCIQR